MIEKIVFITNDPAPYRVPIFNRMALTPGISFHVIFCCNREPNRLWTLPPMRFAHTFLRKRFFTIKGRYIHNNPDVIGTLKQLAPDVIITDGFNPTHLYSFGYAAVKRIPHVAMTDGTIDSEKTLSVLHKMIRRFVYARTQAFVWASQGGKKLYENYGIAHQKLFRSCLCVENSAYSVAPQDEKSFDFIFSGRIEVVKNPLFALDVALAVAKTLKRKVSILFVGAGSQEERVKAAAASHPDLLRVKFNGFAAQHELPALYRSARIFLFPTLWDPWGVVANEACAAGLPVLVSPHAGVAGELVLHGQNGFICDLDVTQWAERAVLLLTQPDVYQQFSDCSLASVSKFTFDDAASGLIAAARFATRSSKRGAQGQVLRRTED